MADDRDRERSQDQAEMEHVLADVNEIAVDWALLTDKSGRIRVHVKGLEAMGAVWN